MGHLCRGDQFPLLGGLDVLSSVVQVAHCGGLQVRWVFAEEGLR